MATAATADPIISIQFGPDRLDIAPAQILTVEAMFDLEFPYVAVTLAPELQFALTSLTLVHVGQQGTIRVCGQVVSQPFLQAPVKSAAFVIANNDFAQIHDLAVILKARDCTPEAVS